MLKFFSRLKIAPRREIVDGRRVYHKIMQQSRLPVFYGNGLAPDNYDGRMEVLCLHLGLMTDALRGQGEMAEKLSQAIYDVMIADFDVALREEGLSDTGVKRRIKPLAKMYFERAREYSEALRTHGAKSASFVQAVEKHLSAEKIADHKPSVDIGVYAQNFAQNLQACSLGEIAKAEFEFPKI